MKTICLKAHNVCLRELFVPSKNKLLLLIMFLLLATIDVSAQSSTAEGVVTDINSTPLPNVSVLVSGSSRGVITDDNGKFSIKVKPGETLVFSRINYKTVTVKPDDITAVLSIKMEREDVSGEEVIVVGYGRQKKANLTGAVGQVDGEVLENRPITNSIAGLQGAAPGLVITRSSGKPGNEGYNINIRGISSVNGTNSPLVIIDGAPGNLSTLNPDDIESVSILKDAAAAIYGAESSNGVLIVTTKSGTRKKFQVDISSLFSQKRPYNIPERNPAWVEAEMGIIASRNAGITSRVSENQLRWIQSPDTNYLVDPTIQFGFNYYESFDPAALLLKNKTGSQQHNATISGSGDKANYLFSLGYYTQDGVFRHGPDKYDRINARMNLDVKLSNKLKFTSRVGYTNTDTRTPVSRTDGDYGLLYNILSLPQTTPLYIPRYDISTAGRYDSTKFFVTPASIEYARLTNGSYDQTRAHNFEGVFSLKMSEIVKGFSLTALYAPRYIATNREVFSNKISVWNNLTTPVPSYNVANFSRIGITEAAQNIQFLADYDYKTGDHGFHLLGGYQYDSYQFRSQNVNAANLFVTTLPSVNFPTDPTKSTAPSDDYGKKVLISVFGRLNYDYAGKYLLEATLRNDGSSQLSPDSRFSTYGSVLAGWLISKENWFPQSNIVNDLKIRASYATLGNSTVFANSSTASRYYAFIETLSRGSDYPFNDQRAFSFYAPRYASQQKEWERNRNQNIGLDVGLFSRRLTMSFDYFIKENLNMLVTPNVPAIFGLTPDTRNIASLKTKGWELDVRYRSNPQKEVTYFAGFNISDQVNKVTSYLGAGVYSLGTQAIIEGLPINTIWGFKTDGYYTSQEDLDNSPKLPQSGVGDIKYVDVNGDGNITTGSSTKEDHGDLVLLGDTNPRYSFGANLGAAYKGVDVSAFLQGVLKRKMLIASQVALPYVQWWRQSWQIQNDYWTPENTDAKFPRLYEGAWHNANASEHWIQNASYIRLKNIQIGYTLPQRLLNKIHIKRLRFYISGEDVWEKTGMWFNYYDPEQPNNATYNYPFFRTFSAGLNLTF